MEHKKNNSVESLVAVFLFWLFGLLIGLSLGSRNAWFAIFGIFSLVASFIIMPKKTETIVKEEAKDDLKDFTME